MAVRKLNFTTTFSVSNRFRKEVFITVLLCVTLLDLFDRINPSGRAKASKCLSRHTHFIYNVTVERYFERRKYWQTSNLGSFLFKNKPLRYKQQHRTFNVLIWNRQWWPMEIDDPLSMCSVNNCVFSYNNSLIDIVDAVLVPTYRAQFPKVRYRNTTQRWVFTCNESPVNRFAAIQGTINNTSIIKSMANIFNWSMTYRSDSDVPTPYGRTVALPEELAARMTCSITKDIIPFWQHKKRDVLVAAVISNCHVYERNKYLHEFKKYVKVDLFGNCSDTQLGKEGCPLFPADCPKLGRYLFLLAFENSGCRQYITEKVFHNAFTKGAIPIVMGAPVADYEKLLPPNSFLHVNSFSSPRELAMEIISLSSNDGYLETYHRWRQNFKIVNEHGNFGSKLHDFCRLCEALNYNDNKSKVYDEDTLKLFLEPKLLCTTPVNPPSTTD